MARRLTMYKVLGPMRSLARADRRGSAISSLPALGSWEGEGVVCPSRRATDLADAERMAHHGAGQSQAHTALGPPWLD